MKALNENMYLEKVFYIKTKKIEDTALEEKLAEALLELCKSLVSHKQAYHSFAFLEEAIFLFINEIKAYQIINFLQSHGVLISYNEITTEVLMGRMSSLDFQKTFLEDDEFKHVLERFLIENLTVDIVLDKINEKGIGSLHEIDYMVLGSSND